MARKHPVIQRDDTIRSVLLGVFVLALALAVVLSDRPLFYGSQDDIIAGAPLPASKLPADFIRIVDDYGLHIPKLRRRPILSLEPDAPPAPIDDRANATPVRFGYSIREGAAAGLPFRAWTDNGHVLYYETPREFVVAPVTDSYLRQVGVPMAKPLDAGDYSFWPHRWGWLFVIAAISIALFEWRAQARRRDALGLI